MKLKLPLFIFLAILFSSSRHAERKAKMFPTPQEENQYMISHYNDGCQYYANGEWLKASNEFEKVSYFFSNRETGSDSFFYLGICYYQLSEYDFANWAFSEYLKTSSHPHFFQEVINYKFCIAEYFKDGERRRPLTMRYCPKWMCAKEMALSIYDEIILALPNHEFTAQALYSKGSLLLELGECWDSVESFQTLIRRFPKHELTPLAYLNINKAYYLQSSYECQNPDIIALAELNVRKFREDFPRDEKVDVAEEYVCKIKETYAKGLFSLGSFYERKGHLYAAAIYYRSSVEQFPNTRIANACRNRLSCLAIELPEEGTDLCEVQDTQVDDDLFQK